MCGMLAVALNLEGWRGPVVFIILAVASIVILTRLIEWGANRLKARVAGKSEVVLSEPKAYESYDERHEALAEGNLDDWLERARVTPVDRKIKPHSRYWVYKAGVHPTPLFTYYRTNPGGRILKHVETLSEGLARFQTEDPDKTVCRSFEGLSVAYPVSGEWWWKLSCAKHFKVPDCDPRAVTKEDGWFFDPRRIEELECGCLAPCNFGKGLPKPPPGGTLYPLVLNGLPVVGTGMAGTGGASSGEPIVDTINNVIKESASNLAKVLDLKMLEKPPVCPSCGGASYTGTLPDGRTMLCGNCFSKGLTG